MKVLRLVRAEKQTQEMRDAYKLTDKGLVLCEVEQLSFGDEVQ